MKILKILFAALTIASMALISSCKKEGCTDPTSLNYSEKAKKDNGTCQYSGEVVFWYDQATSEALIDYWSTSLTFYVDGQIVGSTATNVYWTSAPECGANASITAHKDLGNAKNKSYSYRVVDDLGEEIWSGVINCTANTCLKQQLTW